MGIEKKMFRGMFDPGELVELRQICFTSGKVFSPGKYIADELPDTAFEMGLVDKLPSVKGNNDEITSDAEN
jgi:hypothetical protein